MWKIYRTLSRQRLCYKLSNRLLVFDALNHSAGEDLLKSSTGEEWSVTEETQRTCSVSLKMVSSRLFWRSCVHFICSGGLIGGENKTHINLEFMCCCRVLFSENEPNKLSRQVVFRYSKFPCSSLRDDCELH